MLRLMLFRHAHADRPADIDDHARALSARGQEQAQRMGRYLRDQNLVPALAIVSSARRTQETWKEAAGSGGFQTSKIDEPRIYEAATGDLLQVVREQPSAYSSVMLVGHNPGMERLAAWLIGTGNAAAAARMQREFVVAGLAVIDFDTDDWARLDARTGRLVSFETPDTTPGAENQA